MWPATNASVKIPVQYEVVKDYQQVIVAVAQNKRSMLDENFDTGSKTGNSNRAPGINGDSDVLAGERAINELRRGRAVAVSSAGECYLVLSIETASPDAIENLSRLATQLAAPDAHGHLTLAVSARRARALALTNTESSNISNGEVGGLSNGHAFAVRLQAHVSPSEIRSLAGIDDITTALVAGLAAPPPAATAALTPVLASARGALQRVPASISLDAAVELSRYARLLPTVIALTIPFDQLDPSVLRIEATQVEHLRATRGTGLERIVSARVPLRDEENCELVLFRDTGADVEHLAIVVGNITGVDAVPVRVHSACLTGDVLGSLRCDCGDQLRGAMRRMSERGGGVLLYLEQEGRGIGLANKLRAYSLQDGGLDTFDADGHLGFDDDDRSFTEAATMLRSLGVLRIQLMTNNPHKVDALAREGIDVVAREALTGERNPHNERYLSAKATRAGHHLHNETEGA